MSSDVTAALLGAPGTVLVVGLIVLLVLMEISASSETRSPRLGRALGFAIVPLFIVFAIRVAVQIVEAL